MKTIIVPTDFSECAGNALKVAADIARKMGASIHLVHVFERPGWEFSNLKPDNSGTRKIQEKISEELEKIRSFDFMKNITVVKHIFSGIKLYQALRNKMFSSANLIAMGSHGASGWREFLVGSNTEKVVRHTHIPVLVIKEWFDHFEMRNMVFASDFVSAADETFLKIEKFARLFVAKIHLLKVITSGNFESSSASINYMKVFARKHLLSEFTINTFNDDSIEEGILHFSKKINADLVAMETHGRTGIAHLISGSIAENVVNHTPHPVLCLNRMYQVEKTSALEYA